MSFEDPAAKLSHEELVQLYQTAAQQISELKQQASDHKAQAEIYKEQKEELKLQLDWFKRQLFGEKSERRILGESSEQITLGECLGRREQPPEPDITVKEYQRQKRRKKALPGSPDDSGLRFDEADVPVEVIELKNPEIEGLSPDEYEVIGKKNTYRLAQRPGSYVVIRYTRKTIKLKSSGELVTPAAPDAVFEKSYADVTFLVGLIIEKFLFHLPLYRQHQRLQASGIELSGTSLSNFVLRSADLLEPVYYALLSSILQSHVLTMDETPVKAGRKCRGKMNTAYFWPIYGDKDEIAFPFSPSRGTDVVREVLSEWCGVLVTDGYKVYDRFAQKVDEVVHAQYWVHARRYFEKASKVEPELPGKTNTCISQHWRCRKYEFPCL